jgi:vacuolar-type H+-ATPase subunit E/Vma4
MMRDMPLKLKDELLREIDAEIEQTLARARQDAEAIVTEARRRRESREREGLRRLEDELNVSRRRALARAELDGRNALLRLKREETDRAFAAAREELARMESADPDRYVTLLESIFRSCRRMLPPGPVKARIGRGKEALRERLAGEEGVEAVSDPDLRGVILESADGRMHCDGSLEGLLSSLRQERAAEIEGILFGDGDEREE